MNQSLLEESGSCKIIEHLDENDVIIGNIVLESIWKRR